MIGFNHLGNLGRLGNQMFEFAALRGIAAEHQYDICIPPADHTGIENYSLHECFELDHIKTGFVKDENYSLEQTFHLIKICILLVQIIQVFMDFFSLGDILM